MISQITLGDFFWLLVGLSIIWLAILTLAGFFGRQYYLLDICDQFRAQYSVLLIGFCIISFLGGRYILSSIALAFLVLNVGLILPIFIAPPDWRQGEKDIRLLLANILRKNQAYSKVLDLVQASQPDMIALVEPDQVWMEALKSLEVNYPYRITSLREDNYGLALMSRYPLEDHSVRTLTAKGTPTLQGNVRVNGRLITIIVTHPPPPKNTPDTSNRNLQIAELADWVRSISSAIILCGDFNIAPWSASYRRMERVGKLVDTSRGFGYQPTWPVDRPWLRVPIDQCLVSKDLVVTQRSVASDIGSDHFPVIVDIKFRQI